MKPIDLPLRVIGIGLCLFGLAACGPRTPNAAAETPFIPPTTLATNAIVPPTEAAPVDGYPAVPTAAPPVEGYPVATLPLPTQVLEGYPGTGNPTATVDPYEAGAATPTTAPTALPAATNTSAPVFITYRDFEIVPAQTTIKVGTTVNFLIEGGDGSFHQPYAGASAPFIFEAPPNMGNGVSWPHTFDTAQTLTILCGYHPNMSATLIVEP